MVRFLQSWLSSLHYLENDFTKTHLSLVFILGVIFSMSCLENPPTSLSPTHVDFQANEHECGGDGGGHLRLLGRELGCPVSARGNQSKGRGQ